MARVKFDWAATLSERDLEDRSIEKSSELDESRHPLAATADFFIHADLVLILAAGMSILVSTVWFVVRQI